MSKVVWAFLGLLFGICVWELFHLNDREVSNVLLDGTSQSHSELVDDLSIGKRSRGMKTRMPRSTGSARVWRPQEEELQEADWSDESLYQVVELDQPSVQEVSLLTDETIVAMFKYQVPQTAKTIKLSVDGIPARIAMFGLSGTPLSGPNDATDINPGEETYIAVSRYDYLSPLEAGWFYFAVVVNDEDAGSLIDQGVESVPISVNASMTLARVDGQLEVGKKVSSSLGPEVGCYRTFELEIPEGTDAVRIDLNRSSADLDIAVRQRRQIVDTDFADGFATELESRESLVLRREDFENLDEVKWYVDVYSPFNQSFTEFDLHVTAGEAPPAELLVLPDLDLETTPAENAMLATVQVGTQTGAASGTIVSSDGLILTNYHVISEAEQFASLLDDESESEVVIAVSTDPGVPPIEYFRGKVIQQSEQDDLALVKIISGYYGQPLPDGYKFPFVDCRCAKANELGAAVRICGYPLSGGIENNATISISAGILSGFLDGRYLKTDADIASGNSGGAAFDDQWRLIGVPTMTIEDSNGAGPTMGVMMSLELVPDSWGVEIER